MIALKPVNRVKICFVARPKPTDADIRRRNSEVELRVLCWCKCATVSVPAAEVRAGRTLTCGRRMCNALEFTAIIGSAGDEPCDCGSRT